MLFAAVIRLASTSRLRSRRMFAGHAFCNDGVLLGEHHAAVRETVDAVKVVGGKDDGLAGIGQTFDEIGQPG